MPEDVVANELSVEQFHASVLEMNPKVAVFDCDGTLWSGDAGSAFMRWSMEPGDNGRPALLGASQTAWLKERYEGYKRGEVSELAICGEMVQVYRDIPVVTLRVAAEDFFAEHVEANIFPAMREVVSALQEAGCDIWAVSSTNDWVIEEGVARFGIPAERVLAAQTEEVNGRAGSRLVDVPTDEGKVAALRRVGIESPDVVFGNSVHDAAMLAIAKRAFPVNPSPALVERAGREGWAVFYPTAAGT